MVMRLYYRKLGGHYHCRLFTAPQPNQTFAKCGDLIFDEREWPEVKAAFSKIANLSDDSFMEAHT